ncbi:hypothetical protein [Streptomyces sp. ST2-7A]|uniref:hypothetical protein n=1 Tax=Streptomyces sp. ST2-7A TaxID=2907214 RepID=UPI001F43BF5F|nr:hypothetical protein [Streptomyces sp. ST2-7A]MCE7081833.1 hypothetical protein [Streptomyces sp. ST2-7A]
MSPDDTDRTEGAGMGGAAAPPGGFPEAAGLPALPGVPADLLSLHRELGAIGESYRIAERQVLVRRARAAVLAGRLVTIRAQLAALRNDVGAIARAQYRAGPPHTDAPEGDASVALRLLLGGADPAAAVERETTLRRLGEGTAARIERLEGLERRAATLAARARSELDTGQEEAERRRKHRSEVRLRLDALREAVVPGTPPGAPVDDPPPDGEDGEDRPPGADTTPGAGSAVGSRR